MNLKEALIELAEATKRIINDRIKQYGVNERAGKNTLEGSNLQRTMRVEPIEDGIALQIADYWQHIALGWKRTHNYPNTMQQFVYNLTMWVRKKGIRFEGRTENQTVWAILTNIWTNGIKARPFMIYDDDGDLTKMIPELDAYLDKWFDNLFEEIMKDINKYFN